MGRVIRAPRGRELRCKGWRQEGALRMLMNNLDPEVAERPDELIVYGGTGRAARDWPSFDAIVRSLQGLSDDETLLVASGKPVGIFRTHDDAPRVLIANANLVGHWSNWEEFHRLERMGLTMYGQMTAGSWIYIGSQGIVQGTFETFAAAAARHFGGSLAGRLIVSGGMGGMGGAQPLAATMNGACFLGIDVDPKRIEKRIETGYCDRMTAGLDEALQMLEKARCNGEALSVGLVGNCADIIPELARRGVVPDVLTDQTSAHDPLNGYVPNGLTLAHIFKACVGVERRQIRPAHGAVLIEQQPGAINTTVFVEFLRFLQVLNRFVDAVLLAQKQGGIQPGRWIVRVQLTGQIKFLCRFVIVSCLAERFAQVAAQQASLRLQRGGHLEVLPAPLQTALADSA